MKCIRELRWDRDEWATVWHVAAGRDGDDPRDIACANGEGSGSWGSIVDPCVPVDRAPTCARCSNL